MKHRKQMIHALLWAGVLAGQIFITSNAHAIRFANQFIEFELPANWQCNLEGAEWVCQSRDENQKRDAIIILAAKLRGNQDSLDQYLSYLKQSKTYSSVDGKQVKSDPKYTKTADISGQAWVDSLHLESEIPGFYTRYLATIKDDIGILVTYSINKAKYQAYLNEFEAMVKTLKAFRKSGGLNAGPKEGDLFTQTKIPTTLNPSSVFPNITAPTATGTTSGGGKSGSTDDIPWEAVGLAVAVVAYLIWKRRRGGGSGVPKF